MGTEYGLWILKVMIKYRKKATKEEEKIYCT